MTTPPPDTLKRTEDCENVVGGNLQDTVGEEDKTPCDTQSAAQSKDNYDSCASECTAHFGSAVTEELGRYDDEDSNGKQENQCIVAYVYNPVDNIVCYPAPTVETQKYITEENKHGPNVLLLDTEIYVPSYMVTFSSVSLVVMSCAPYFPTLSRTTTTTTGRPGKEDRDLTEDQNCQVKQQKIMARTHPNC